MEEAVRTSYKKQFRIMKILFRLTLKNILKTKRTIFLALFSISPVLISVLYIIMRLTRTDIDSGLGFYNDLMGSFQIRGILLVLAVFYGSTVFTDEIDRKTLVYLQARPITARTMIFSKFYAAFIVTTVLITLSTIVCYVMLTLSDGGGKIMTPDYLFWLWRDLLAFILGAIVYSAFMLMLSLLFKKPVLWGLVFTLGWENTVANIPGPIHKLTILHWVESIFPQANVTNKFLSALHPDPSRLDTSIIVCLVLTAVFLIGSIYLYKKKEFSLTE